MESGVLDQVLEADSKQRRIVPCNAAVFTKGQILQVWTKLNGTFRGVFTVDNVVEAKRATEVSYLEVDNLPAGTQRGDLLILDTTPAPKHYTLPVCTWLTDPDLILKAISEKIDKVRGDSSTGCIVVVFSRPMSIEEAARVEAALEQKQLPASAKA